MGIHIYKYSGHSAPTEENFLWCITENEYLQLENCFDIFNRRTGKIFDEYSDLEFPKGTLGPLKKSIEEAIQHEKNKETIKALNKLSSTVESAIVQDFGLSFYGD